MNTPIDTAVAERGANPDSDQAQLSLLARVAEAELYLVLDEDADEERVKPTILQTSAGALALAFDREERMVSFTGEATHFVAMSGRRIAEMLVSGDTGLALNVGTEHETVLDTATLAWMLTQLAGEVDEAEQVIFEVFPPRDLPEAFVLSVDRKLAQMAGLAEAALLAKVRYASGVQGHALAMVGAQPDAQPALANAIAEGLRLSGLDAAALDVLFVEEDNPITAAFARNGLRFDIPEPEPVEVLEVSAPGMDPNKPPRLV
ncbi:MAG: SseB family protein [Pseudomonadota bacterium]